MSELGASGKNLIINAWSNIARRLLPN